MNPAYRKSLLVPVLMILTAPVFSALDVGYRYDKLPPHVPSHFDLRGRADGWSTKLEFVSLMAATFLVVTLIPVPIVLLAHLASPSLFNLPNKEFWFAPERQAETRRAIARWALWFTAATLWLLSLLLHETLAASFRQPPKLHWFGWLLGGYIALVLISVFRLIQRFSRVSQEDRVTSQQR